MTQTVLLAAKVSEQVGAGVFLVGLLVAIVSFIVGIVRACSNRPNKWLEALFWGIAVPVTCVGIAFAGCSAALGGL